jgi:hypothetical protein
MGNDEPKFAALCQGTTLVVPKAKEKDGGL